MWDHALYGAVLYCKKKTGYGSTKSLREYLYVLTRGPEAPFMVTKNDEGKKIIVKRTGN
jgi:hypothetical protein